MSADPFFNSERVRLVQVVKQASLKGCYPFREYVKEANGDFYFGPSLYDAYKLLGTKAQQVLAMRPAERLQIRTSIGIVDAAPTSGQATGLQQIWNWLTGLVSR